MSAIGERRLLVAGGALLAAGAIWLLGGVPAAPAGDDAASKARQEALQALYRSAPPADQAGVHQLVVACELADEAEVERLRELAESEDPLLAGNAIAALGRLGKVDAASDLAGKLDDPRPRVRHEMIAALGQSGDKAAARHLVPWLRSDDEQAALLSIQALARLGVTEPLQALLVDPEVDARTKAFVKAAQEPVAVPELLATTSGLDER